MTPLRVALVAVASVALALGVLFALAFRDRYWLRRDCFNDLGRCWDPMAEQVFLESAGVAWGLLTGFALFVGAGALFLARRLGRHAARRR